MRVRAADEGFAIPPPGRTKQGAGFLCRLIAVGAAWFVAAGFASAGTFTATTSGAGMPGEIHKVTINIQYTPSVNCGKVVLIQTVKISVSNEDGTMSMGLPFSDVDTLDHMDDDKIADGTAVDHSYCEKDPYYNGDDPQDGGTKGKKTAAETADSTMSDTPAASVPKNGKPKFTAMFEVCAYCADAVPATSLNECMRWTYMSSQANGETIGDIQGTGAGNAIAPTQSHNAAVTQFNGNHMNNTKCPEKVADDAVPGPGGMLPRDVDPFTVPPPGCSEVELCGIVPALNTWVMLVLAVALMATSGFLLSRRGRQGPPGAEVVHG